MESLFLYQRWMNKTLEDYVTSKAPSKLKGKVIAMSPRQYGAALMQAYFGKASLGWISEVTAIPLEHLRDWRKEPQFLFVMDWSKSIFSESFQQKIEINDYSVAQYHEISGEFSILEESLQVATRARLYARFKSVGEKLMSHHKHGLSMENFDLILFRRLFLFFLALEYHWPTVAGSVIQKNFLPFARDVAWPLLGQDLWVEAELYSIQHEHPSAQIRLLLGNQLREMFNHVN